MSEATRLILASQSPRRRELFAACGFEFDVIAPNVLEEVREGESPKETALRLACEKALQVSAENPNRVTIGADTVVDVDGVAFGKPIDRADSLRMLRTLSGRRHLVHTGIATALSGTLLDCTAETTAVVFGPLAETDILRFAESGLGDDKAGSYAIQGRGALLVERIDGCYYNVVGLPLFRLDLMLKKLENRHN